MTEALRTSLLALLAQRGASLTDEERRQIEECFDGEKLAQWLAAVIAGEAPSQLLQKRL
jgi:hypothetical protein